MQHDQGYSLRSRCPADRTPKQEDAKIMAGLSLTAVWDDTLAFIRRESALLLPLAFATFGLGTLAFAFIVPDHPPGTRVEPGPWLIWGLPALLLMMIGNIAVSRIALRSGVSVADVLRDAIRLMPRAIGIGLLMAAGITATLLVVGVIAMLLKFDQRSSTILLATAMVPIFAWIGIRLAVLWPTLADRELSVVDTLKQTLALTRGNALRIAGLIFINFALYIFLSAVIELAGGSVLIILARLIQAPDLAPVLVAILMAAFSSIYAAFWSIFLARLYVQLSASRSGT